MRMRSYVCGIWQQPSASPSGPFNASLPILKRSGFLNAKNSGVATDTKSTAKPVFDTNWKATAQWEVFWIG